MTTQHTPLLFINATLVDGVSDTALKNHQLLVEDGKISQISAGSIDAPSATVVDLKGKTLMPGLIDCHVHVIASSANLGQNAMLPDSLITARREDHAGHAEPRLYHRARRRRCGLRSEAGAGRGLAQRPASHDLW